MVLASPYDFPQLQDTDILRSYVKKVWISESAGLNEDTQQFNYYADGCPGIFFQQTEGDVLLNGSLRKKTEIYLYGQTVRPVQFQADGPFRFIVFYLYPPVAKYLFDIKAKDVTDTCMDLSVEHYAKTIRLIDRLTEAVSAGEQVKIISDYLAGLIRRNNIPGEKMLEYALAQIHVNADDKSLQSIRKSLNVTERTFERKFEQYVGISPRLYAKIWRFNQSLTQLDAQHYTKLSDLAFDNGYADQSHFIRTFKSFTGLTPSEYLQTKA